MKHVIDFADILKKDNIGDTYKFVQVGGSYRFGWIDTKAESPVQHADLLNAGEQAEAAGRIGVWDDMFQLVEDYSLTLDLGCTDEHMSEIAIGLQLEYGGKI